MEQWDGTPGDAVASAGASQAVKAQLGLRELILAGELAPGARPDELAVALLAVVQGGILLSQIHRKTTPMEIALDTMIDHIASLTVPARRPRTGTRNARP